MQMVSSRRELFTTLRAFNKHYILSPFFNVQSCLEIEEKPQNNVFS